MTAANDASKHFGLWLLAFVLTVIGAQCWLVSLYGSALPFWDQWDEALTLFKPWKEGHLTLADVIAPDSDHRIIPTHFLDMALITLNGRWDPLLQMTVNAFIHAVYAAGLAFCLWHFLGRKNGWLVCGLLLPFFTLPFAGENAIWGINSLWYFINVFGLAAIVGLGFFRPGSWLWWLGLAAALLSLLTMALGPFPPVAVAGLMILRAIKNRRLDRQNLISLGACLLLAGLGLAMGVHAQGYHPLQAHSFAEFVAAIIRHLGWPFYRWPGMAGVIALPLVVLLVYYLRPNFQAPRAAEFLLTLALWSVIQSTVLAFGRANYGEGIPASRYTEVFSVLLMASLFATVLLGEQWHNRFPKWNGLLLPLVFAGVIFWGLQQMSDIVVDNLLLPTRIMNVVAEERTATFMATGNEKDLLERPTIGPKPEVALEVFRNKDLQPILPVSCIPPGAGHAGWLTTASAWLLRHAIVMVAGGLILFIGLCGFGLARGTMDLTLKKPEGIVALVAGLAALSFVWSKQSLQRESVEFGIQQQLAADFKSAGSLGRAAYHAQKADELKAVK
jgi:hypothetical protein